MEFPKPGEPDLVCDIWTEINRNLVAELAAEGNPELTTEQLMARREIVDYQVMERLRRRIDTLVRDRHTAELLKPYYRLACKRPLSSDTYYPTFNQANVTLIDVDVSDTQDVEAIEGQVKAPWALLRGYGPGWTAFVQLLQDWRDQGELTGVLQHCADGIAQ